MEEIIAYTDGSAIGNPGPGGWGFVVLKGKHVYEGGGDAVHTTNNRMEMTASLMALRSFKTKTALTLKTDSQYVINGITKWVFGWEKNGWQTKEKKEVLNKDIWQELLTEVRKHTVTWEHVRGHEGVSLNERVDMIANGYARKESVQLFEGTKRAYDAFLATMPKARVVSKSSSKTKKTGPAYAYISLVEGEVLSHKTWAECESRVKGKKAKFKKVFSKEEEETFKNEWMT